MFNLNAFLSYVVVVTFTPGPNNIMSMVNSGKFGFKKTFKFMLGVASGFFVIMLLSSFFNLFLFKTLPQIQIFMKILGTAYLLYLASKIMGFDPIHQFMGKDKKSGGSGAAVMRSFKTGMLLQFINPKAILYGITIVANFIIPFYDKTYQLILFALFLSLTALASVCSWGLFGSIFNKFLSKYEKPFNVVMALLLVYSALTILGIA